MHMSTHTERICTISIPIMIPPPVAPLPEIEQSIDAHYEEGEAGPSFLGGAPPPFEEREAPPPFFSAEAEASTSSRLPTFLESETEIFVPAHDDPSIVPQPLPFPQLVFEGEGQLFGFPASEQFDGYAIDLDRSYTPPPTLEMATRDADVTGFANLPGGTAMEVLGLALEQHDSVVHEGIPPPPPPPMDDPSDPPPSIDSDFRAPGNSHQTIPSHPRNPPGLPVSQSQEDGHSIPTSAHPQDGSHGHAPPPYRVPDNDLPQEHEHVVRPPPYVDLVMHSPHAQ